MWATCELPAKPVTTKQRLAQPNSETLDGATFLDDEQVTARRVLVKLAGMAKTLYLLDGMALAYRAHFALMRSPIFTSGGVNTSALYGFTQTLVELLRTRQPTHLAVVFDTSAPTARHREFPDYKAQREEMPEDLAIALPVIRRLCDAMHVPVLFLDGYEADDIIGTLARRAEAAGDFTTFMVTPDKDFAQLVSERTLIYRPGTAGSGAEILGPAEVRARWEIDEPSQVIDVLGLWGDASDNIPGVPGIGEKSARTLIKRFGSVESLLEHTAELKGKQKENIETHAEKARLSKRLATITTDVPIETAPDALAVVPMDEEKVKALFVEFEFNTLGRRLFGEDFRAGRGGGRTAAASAAGASEGAGEPPGDLFAQSPAPAVVEQPAAIKTIADVPHDYRVAKAPQERATLIAALLEQNRLRIRFRDVSARRKDRRDLRPFIFVAEPHRLVRARSAGRGRPGGARRIPRGVRGGRHRKDRPQFEVRPRRPCVAWACGLGPVFRHDARPCADRTRPAARARSPRRSVPGIRAGSDHRPHW